MFIKLLRTTSSIICVFAVVLGRRVPRKHPPVSKIAFLLQLPSMGSWVLLSTVPHVWHRALSHFSPGWLQEANGFGSFINNERHRIQTGDREGWEEQPVFFVLESSCLGIPCSSWQLLTRLKHWSFKKDRETKAFTNSIFLLCEQFNYIKDFCQVWTDLCFLVLNYQFIYSLENRSHFS